MTSVEQQQLVERAMKALVAIANSIQYLGLIATIYVMTYCYQVHRDNAAFADPPQQKAETTTVTR